MGLEPTRPCGHKILSLARLPIPTLPHLSLLSRDLIIITNRKMNVKEKFKFFVGFFVKKMIGYNSRSNVLASEENYKLFLTLEKKSSLI